MIRYRAGKRDDYVVRPIDDLTLVYHRPSGTTHVVVPAVVALLDVLCGRTASLDTIVGDLASRHELSADGDAGIADILAARLDEMARMDLVDRLD